MNRRRRVAVTASGALGDAAPAPPTPGTPLDPDRLAAARRIRRAQLRRASLTLVLGAVLLVGLPVLLHHAPELVRTPLLGVPGGWLAVALLPYPLLAALAWGQLVAAERAERPTQRPAGTGSHDDPPGTGA